MADVDALRDPGLANRVPEQPTPTATGKTPGADPSTMSLVDHLAELRSRVFKAVLAVVVGSVIGFWQADRIIHILKAPLPTKTPLVTLGPGDAFFINIKVALATGLIIAMPVLLFQLWRFISPGLTPEERRMARPWVPLALLFFSIGVGIAYFILPYATGFLLSFQSADLVAMIAADRYFDFITTLFLAFGLVMEFPIVLVLLSKVGIITSKRLTSNRRMVILGITVFATLVTPGGDIVSPIVMAVTMYILYEVSVVLVRAGGR